jgi:hypothetical protein
LGSTDNAGFTAPMVGSRSLGAQRHCHGAHRPAGGAAHRSSHHRLPARQGRDRRLSKKPTVKKMTSWPWSGSRAASMWMLQAPAPRPAMRSTSGENRTFVFSSPPD